VAHFSGFRTSYRLSLLVNFLAYPVHSLAHHIFFTSCSSPNHNASTECYYAAGLSNVIGSGIKTYITSADSLLTFRLLLKRLFYFDSPIRTLW